MLTRVLWASCAFTLLFLATACSDDDGDADTLEGVDTGAILSNVEDVRAIIERNAPDLDAGMVHDVAFEDGSLTVKLAESPDIDTSGLEDVCRKISEAIALPDLSVTVESPDGSGTAECGSGA